MSDLAVEAWVVHEQVDFMKFETKPVQRVLENIGRYSVERSRIWSVNLFVQRNYIEAFDHKFFSI